MTLAVLAGLLCAAATDRAWCAILAVTSTADDGSPGTLRWAITQAEGNGESNTIALTVTGTITLTSALPTVNSTMVLDGPGAGVLTFNGNDAYQHFTVWGDLTIRNVTLSHGRATGDPADGGSIANFAALTLERVVFSDNRAYPGVVGPAHGGAIYSAGTLTATDCSFVNNRADGRYSIAIPDPYDAWAGAIFADAWGNAALSGCVFSGNAAQGGGQAGVFGGHAHGGALSDGDVPGDAAIITLVNCTFTGNTATGGTGAPPGWGFGGAVSATETTYLEFCTLAGNSAGDFGGGIFSTTSSDDTGPYIFGTLIANNTAPSGPDISSRVQSRGYNLIRDPTDGDLDVAGNGNTAAGNIAGQNPLLGPLANNGGPTLTMALLTGSPAIDAGSNALAPATDQRGVVRPLDGDGNGSVIADIGAFEVDVVLPTIVLSTTAPDPTNAAIPVTATLSEPCPDFAVGALTVTNATVAAFSGGGTSYSFELVPIASGVTTVTVGAGACHDVARNPNVATAALSRTVDLEAPTVTHLAPGLDPYNIPDSAVFDVSFSEDVFGFDSDGDVTVTCSGLSYAGASVATLSATQYRVAVTGITGDGSIQLTVNAAAARDAAGNPNPAAGPSVPLTIQRGLPEPPLEPNEPPLEPNTPEPPPQSTDLPDLYVTLWAPPDELVGTLRPGQEAVCVVTVENRGVGAATDVVLVVTLPNDMAYLSALALAWGTARTAPVDVIMGDTQLSIAVGLLAPGEGVRYRLAYRATGRVLFALEAELSSAELTTPVTATLAATGEWTPSDGYPFGCPQCAAGVCGPVGVFPLLTILGIAGLKQRRRRT